MEERMLSMYAEMSNDETEEEFMSNYYPPIQPERSKINLSDQAEQILYRCRIAIQNLIHIWDMEEEIIRDLDEVVEIRTVASLLDVWYETSPEGVAWSAWRRDEERYHAHKMAERAKAKADEELEF